MYSEFPATALPASGSKDIISAIFGTPIRLSDANVVFRLEKTKKNQIKFIK